MRNSTRHKYEIVRVMNWVPEGNIVNNDDKFARLEHYFARYFEAVAAEKKERKEKKDRDD